MRFLPPFWFEEIDSTNRAMRDRLVEDPALPEGTVLAARTQTAGRGRLGRRWIASPGRDLAFSFLVREGVEPLSRLASLPISAALAVAELLEKHGAAPRLKWPNDIMIGEKKIGGILVERTPHPAAIVGIGVNLNMDAKTAASIGRPATSLAIETGAACDLDAFLASLLDLLSATLARWRARGFEGLRAAWMARTAPLGETIGIGHGPQARRGRLRGYGPDGELLLETDEGTLHTVWSGEIEERWDDPR